MAYLKKSDKELEEKLPEFQNLIKSKETLPDNIDPLLLLRFLKFYNGNMEKALKRFVASMELRKKYSNIFMKRDTTNPQLRKLITQVEMVPQPKKTSGNNRILTMRLIDFNPEDFTFDDALTVFTMVYDTSVVTRDEGELADGEIVIFDVTGMTAKHLTKIGLSSLKCFIKYMTDAHPVRIAQVHVLNSHSLLDKLMMIMKPFLGARAMKVINFHLPNSQTLFDFISRDVLPEEYGGTCGSIDAQKWHWIHRTEDHREYLLDDDRWKFQSKKVKEQPTDDDAFKYLGLC